MGPPAELPDAVARPRFAPAASSHGLSWAGLVAGEFRAKPDGGVDLPALPHHFLLVALSAGAEFAVRSGGPAHAWRPQPGSITLLPAGRPARWDWRGRPDTLLVLLDAGAVPAAGGPADLHPVRDLHHPPLLAVLAAVRAELHAGGPGGPLCADALRTLLAVHLHRRQAGAAPPPRPGRLAPARLRRVLAHIDAHLAGPLRLADLAAAAGLSAYHFARAFKASTGQPPHAFVLARRVERAKLLLAGRLPVAEVAAAVGFSDQSHFTRQFRRLAGVTPGRFR